MNTSDIEVFLCAADALSFSKAAEEKYMSRQAVSRKVGALEKELGVPLFRRSQRGQRLVLTPEGQRYYDFFRVSQRRWEELRASIHTDLGGSLIHVAYLEGLDFLPSLQQILRDVQDKYGMEGSLSTYDMHDLTETVESDKYDLILAYDTPRLNLFRDYDHVVAGCIPMVLTVRKGLRPKARRASDFSDLPVATWLRKDQTPEEAIRKCTEHCLDFGFRCSSVKVFPNRDTVRAAIELGHGIGICTEIDRLAQSSAVETFPLRGHSTLVCLWRKDERNPVVRSIVRDMKSNGKD